MTNIPIDNEWWQQLTPLWKQAFSVTVFHHNHEPAPQELAQLYEAPALRFAGPTASYPNMEFELTDLSGVAALTQLETLVVMHHRLESVRELKSLTKLRHLFLMNNSIQSLDGIEELTRLEQLYVQCNQIPSMHQVTKLTNLRELYIHDNLISSLNGLTEAHSDKLETFFCKPNDALHQRDILRTEMELGIRCRKL